MYPEFSAPLELPPIYVPERLARHESSYAGPLTASAILLTTLKSPEKNGEIQLQ